MENKKVFERLLQNEFFKEVSRTCILKEFILSPIKKHKVKHLWQIISPCKNWKKTGWLVRVIRKILF